MLSKLPLALASGKVEHSVAALAKLLFLTFPLGFSPIEAKAKRKFNFLKFG